MNFQESIQICLTKYAEFEGTASRAEIGWFYLALILACAALSYISLVLVSVFAIAVLLPTLAVGSRRLHETGRSGWWQLMLLIPIGGVIILAFWWAEPKTK